MYRVYNVSLYYKTFRRSRWRSSDDSPCMVVSTAGVYCVSRGYWLRTTRDSCRASAVTYRGTVIQWGAYIGVYVRHSKGKYNGLIGYIREYEVKYNNTSTGNALASAISIPYPLFMSDGPVPTL